MKKVFFLILVLPLTSVAQRPVIYNLPDAKLNSMTICGKSRVCDPGPIGRIVYRFSKAPYSPNVDNNSTLQSIAASVLGRAVSAGVDKNSEILRVCSKDGITSYRLMM